MAVELVSSLPEGVRHREKADLDPCKFHDRNQFANGEQGVVFRGFSSYFCIMARNVASHYSRLPASNSHTKMMPSNKWMRRFGQATAFLDRCSAIALMNKVANGCEWLQASAWILK